jgi:prefoldin subunit 5
MSASEESRAEWLGNQFWERLDRLEARHQRIQSEHEAARRGLERVRAEDAVELVNAWRRYCEVIADLNQITAQMEAFRSQSY